MFDKFHNSKRPGVEACCYDIGIIGDSLLHWGEYRSIRGCYILSFKSTVIVYPFIVRIM